MTDITPVLQGVIIIAVGIITIFIVPLIKTKLTSEQWVKLSAIVGALVKAAEMLFPAKGEGVKKSDYVKDYLNKHGYDVDADKLEALIESAVCELNKSKTAALTDEAVIETEKETDKEASPIASGMPGGEKGGGTV